MAEPASRRAPYFWELHVDEGGGWRSPRRSPQTRPTGEQLAALRQGLSRAAGTVPAMWPYYVTVNDDSLGRCGLVSDALVGEHAALALFGLHQQSQDKAQHRAGWSLGRSMRTLKDTGRFSVAAVDARFGAAATASNRAELVLHLRSLVTLLRQAEIATDYTALAREIARWEREDDRARIRRRWGHDYFGWAERPAAGARDGAAASD